MTTLPGQQNFSLEEYPLYNLNRTSATYIEEMSNALKQIGMNQAEWRVLGILGDKNPSTVTGIARRSVIKMPTLTRMLDRMEKDKLITRKVWQKDKRIVQIHITSKGRRHLTKAVQVNAHIYARAFHGISEAQNRQLVQTLQKMRENLNDFSYGSGP